MSDIPQIERTRPDVHLRIGDERLASGSGGVYGHIDPTIGQMDKEIPLAGRVEVDQAVQVAHQAFETWRRTGPPERRRLLVRLADLIEQHTPEFARRNVMDNGTPMG